jgi:hypothetical protein
MESQLSLTSWKPVHIRLTISETGVYRTYFLYLFFLFVTFFAQVSNAKINYFKHIPTTMIIIFGRVIHYAMLRKVPVPTAWHVLRLRMEERPPAMEVSSE